MIVAMLHPESIRCALRSPAALLTAALLLLGCSRSDSVANPKPANEAPAPAPAAAAPKVATAQSVLSEASASALVNAWIDAQNRQSFDDYERLYAERFYGVKRAGEITTRFDRKGWLRDRKGMFSRPFRVSVEGLAIRVAAETAVAEFEQSFQSQNYADTGPKQLVMIVQDGVLKITREELFRSGRVTNQALAPSSADFAFVREIGDRRYWIGGDASPEAQLVTGPPVRVGPAGAFAKLSDSSKLPAALKELVGASVAIEPGIVEPPCVAVLSEWGVLAELEPHFATRERWDGSEGEALTEAQIAREIFGPDVVSGRDHHFAVDITEATKRCASARWGRLQSLGAVQHVELEQIDDPDPTLLASLQRSLRKTPAYKDLERNYRQVQPDGTFDEILSDGLTLYEARFGNKNFLLTTFIHRDDCRGFSGELTQVWRVRGQTVTEIQSVLPFAMRPELATDINTDGLPEWISETQLVGWDGREYSTFIDVTPHNYDCPC